MLLNLKTGDAATDEACARLYRRLERGRPSTCSTTTATSGPAASSRRPTSIGIPWQILVGPKGLAEGKVEVKRRATGERELSAARRRRRAPDAPRPDRRRWQAGATRPTKPFAPFEWMLAGRYLRTRRREGFVSVIAGFSFLGIMLGVATLIVVLSVMNGFRKELLDKIVGINGHIFIAPIDQPAHRLRRGRRPRVADVPGVRRAIPMVEGQAFGSSQYNGTGVLVRGRARRGHEADRRPSPGTCGRGPWRISTRAAASPSAAGSPKSLSLQAGDTMTLITPRGASTPFGTAPRVKGYPVVAVFEIGMSEFDATFVYMPLARSADLLQPRRRRERHRGLPRQRRPGRRGEGGDRGCGRAPGPADGLAAAQPDLLRRARSRAQRHVPHPHADRVGRRAQHHLGPDHAREGQVERHRHPAHHGSDAGRHHAGLPDHRRLDRNRRYDRRLLRSAFSSPSTSKRSAPSSRG